MSCACGRSEHGALRVGRKVKEAVRCEHAIEVTAQRQPSHICNDRVLPGKPRFAEVDKRRRRFYPGHVVSFLYEVAGDKLPEPHPMSKIEPPGGSSDRTAQARASRKGCF